MIGYCGWCRLNLVVDYFDWLLDLCLFVFKYHHVLNNDFIIYYFVRIFTFSDCFTASQEPPRFG